MIILVKTGKLRQDGEGWLFLTHPRGQTCYTPSYAAPYYLPLHDCGLCDSNVITPPHQLRTHTVREKPGTVHTTPSGSHRSGHWLPARPLSFAPTSCFCSGSPGWLSPHDVNRSTAPRQEALGFVSVWVSRCRFFGYRD